MIHIDENLNVADFNPVRAAYLETKSRTIEGELVPLKKKYST